MRNYYLFLVTDDGLSFDYLANKHFVFSDSLENIDKFTSCYKDAQELGDDINYRNIPRKFIDAVIVSEVNCLNMIKNNNLFPKKEEKVLFEKDKDFVLNMKNSDSYSELLVYEYENFLLNHRKEIRDSLVRFVNIGYPVDSTINDCDLDRVIFSYYKNKTYKKMRDTYLDLNRKKKKYKCLDRKSDISEGNRGFFEVFKDT